MTAIASLTLADGQATPANHTFAPVGIDQASVAKWADRSGGIALGFPIVSFSLRAPAASSKSRVFKLTAKVVTPVLEVTSPSTSTGIQPAPTLAYNLIANVDIALPERSTVAQRKDLIAFLKNYLATAVLQQAVENFEQVY